MTVSMSFENFVECDANRAALHATLALAEGRGRELAPLGIVGPPGTGKTHLLNAMAVRMAEGESPPRPRYVTPEEFLAGCADAAASGGAHALGRMRARLAGNGALLIDDVQCLDGEPGGQRQLCLLLSELRDRGTPVAFAASAQPDALESLCPELREGLARSVTVEVGVPSPASIRAMLECWAEDVGAKVRDADAVYGRISDCGFGDLRSYRVVLLKVIAFGAVTGRCVDARLVYDLLGPVADG